MNRFSVWMLVLLLITQLAACSSNDSNDDSEPENVAPTANAGDNQTADEETAITLSGSGTDSDGSVSGYSWTQTAGTSVTLNDADSAAATFDTPTTTSQLTLTFQLTVTDDDGATGSDTVSVIVNPVNAAPAAVAGVAQIVDEQVNTLLTGSGTDADGSIASYSWTQTAGASVTIVDSGTASASFASPETTERLSLTFELTVTDNEGATNTDTTVVDVLPVIRGLVVDDILVGSTVQLLSFPDKQLIAETVTDAAGQYYFQQDTLHEYLIISVTGGTMNGIPFVGTLSGFCLISERSSCNITPMSTLIIGYAEQTNTLDEGDKAAWIEQIGTSLEIVLSTDPFIDETQTGTEVQIIRDYLQYGANINDWLTSVLGFIQSGTSNNDINSWFSNTNVSPVVSAGNDQIVNEQVAVTLSGSATDTDGSIDSYSWTQTSGAAVTINSADTATATFQAPATPMQITLTFMLTATDNEGAMSSDSVDIVVNSANAAPTVSAGDDQVVYEQSTVILTAIAADSDGSISSYLWQQTQGTPVTLVNASIAIATFAAPALLSPEVLEFKVTVTDDDNASSSDTVSITVNQYNASPIAYAGVDQVVLEQTNINIRGSGTDTDGTIVGYMWQQTSGTAVALGVVTSEWLNFTTPDLNSDEVLTFSLTVTDNEGATHTDSVNIAVNFINGIPTADAGVSQLDTSGNLVTLDASGSSDVDSSITYSWLQTDASGVVIVLNDVSAESPTFTAPAVTAAETFTFQVTVTDTGGLTDTDSVSIGVAPVISELINDTGLLTCGDYAFGGTGVYSNFEDCANANDGGGDPIPNGQDGDYGRDLTSNDNTDGKSGISLIKLDANGDPLPKAAATWVCLKDNVTGYIWEVKTADAGLRDAGNTYTYYNSTGVNDHGTPGTQNGGACTDAGNCDTEKYVASVNASGLCGASDWQLPNKEQLRSIVDYSINGGPTIDILFFKNVPANIYWTASPDAKTQGSLWGINFTHGGATRYAHTLTNRVMLVRIP